MEVNGVDRQIEEMRTMQGETIPPVQTDFGGFDSREPVFLQVEEEFSMRRIVWAIRGDITPIVQEQ